MNIYSHRSLTQNRRSDRTLPMIVLSTTGAQPDVVNLPHSQRTRPVAVRDYDFYAAARLFCCLPFLQGPGNDTSRHQLLNR
jgi:hypothetical protein